MGTGPEQLVRSGLGEYLQQRGHRVNIAQLLVDPMKRHSEVQTSFELLRLIATKVKSAETAGRFPLIVAGNCLSACGILAGLRAADRAVFWFDAHGDLNTPQTSMSGFLDGMALATALGLCWEGLCQTIPGFRPVTPDRCCLIGARDLDPPELQVVRTQAITHIAPAALPGDLHEFLARPAVHGCAGYVHCDLDVLEPSVAQANASAVPGGLLPAAVVSAIDAIGKAIGVKAAAITAYEPAFDPQGAVPVAACSLAAALVAGAAAN